MTRKLGDIITKDFTTHNPVTGAISDADDIPTCSVFEDDNDTPILSPTVIKRNNLTGNYRVSIDATTANGFEVGKSYNVIVSATVNSVSTKSCIISFALDEYRVADIASDIALMKKVECNNWKIVSNQLIIYDDDGVTPLITFNLKDKNGTLSESNVYERAKVE